MSEIQQNDDEDDIVSSVNVDGNGEGNEAPVLERREGGDENTLKRAIFGVTIEVTVSVGTAHPLVGELLEMKRNHLLPLDTAIDDPVELRVKDQVIARGELTEVPDTDGQLAIRLTEVVNIAKIIDQ
ncbi:MAG: FliM/FliN family flagellar motor switch protein [Marinicaulis sp.]|nr:FliM/FliN family flagellar motor switch protein [Marinicaulis sp.]